MVAQRLDDLTHPGLGFGTICGRQRAERTPAPEAERLGFIISGTRSAAIDQIEPGLARLAQSALVFRRLVETENELALAPDTQHAVMIGANRSS